MGKVISTALIGIVMGVAGCASTSNPGTKVVRTTTTWTCPEGTTANIHNPKPNCSMRAPVSKENLALIDRVKFATGSSELSDASKETLNNVAGALKDDPAVIRINVVARADNSGTEELNATLSQQRADAVKSYLEDQGLPSEKLQTEALGETAPLVPNNTPDGRALNRSASIVAIR